MATGTIRRVNRHQAPRRRNPQANKPQPTGVIHIIAATVTGSTITVTFDQAVGLSGVPQIIPNVASRVPVSAIQPAATQVTITYNGSVTEASTLTCPYQDPAIRNSGGAFIGDTYFNFD